MCVRLCSQRNGLSNKLHIWHFCGKLTVVVENVMHVWKAGTLMKDLQIFRLFVQCAYISPHADITASTASPKKSFAFSIFVSQH